MFFIMNNFRYALSTLTNYSEANINIYLQGIENKELKGFCFAGHINANEYIIALDIWVDWDIYGAMIEKGNIHLDTSAFRDGQVSHEVFAMITQFKQLATSKSLQIVTTFYVVPHRDKNPSGYHQVCDKFNLSHTYSTAQLVAQGNDDHIVKLAGLEEMSMCLRFKK